MGYGEENFPDGKGRPRNGSPTFYALLERMAKVHDTKSHDYANNQNPYGNYKFAGMLSQLFKNPDDAGFVGRIGEKLFRLANLENDGKIPQNEKIEDTEEDICVIVALWMSARRDARIELQRKIERQTRIDRGISLPGVNSNKATVDMNGPKIDPRYTERTSRSYTDVSDKLETQQSLRENEARQEMPPPNFK